MSLNNIIVHVDFLTCILYYSLLFTAKMTLDDLCDAEFYICRYCGGTGVVWHSIYRKAHVEADTSVDSRQCYICWHADNRHVQVYYESLHAGRVSAIRKAHKNIFLMLKLDET